MTIPRDVIEPVAGLSREIGFLVAGLQEVRAQTVASIADVTPEELSRRVTPSFHQIGGLVLHLAETEFWWIDIVFAGNEITEVDRQLFHFDDTTETDFALKKYGVDDCVRILNLAHERTIGTLSEVNDGSLDRLYPFPRKEPKFESSLRWILHHLIDHESNHRGQIAMMKRLMRESAMAAIE
jgi:uncharacterized damage-inducible protein DinB